MMSRRFYPSLVGLLLGLLQTGLFFQLSFTLSSSFGTFLMVTFCWLAGSAVGVFWLARHLRWDTRLFLALALLAYGCCALLLNLAPFDTRLWPVYAALVVVTGIYPGVFFARFSAVHRARTLFLWENNGFIAGLVLGTLLFMVTGRIALWIAPLAAAGVVAAISPLAQMKKD
jgi:hypothetical protein